MKNIKELAMDFVKKSEINYKSNVNNSFINSFSSLFDVQELSNDEKECLESFLITDNPEVEKLKIFDFKELQKITQEVKAIKRQELILIGEKISLARDIFKKYKEKGFRDWLLSIFGSFKTGYNYLSFYDLYKLLPELLRNKLKLMPAKAAYILASKPGSIEQKAQIIEEHSKKPAQFIIDIICELYQKKPEKKSEIDKNLLLIEKNINKIFHSNHKFSEHQKHRILKIIRELEFFLKNSLID